MFHRFTFLQGIPELIAQSPPGLKCYLCSETYSVTYVLNLQTPIINIRHEPIAVRLEENLGWVVLLALLAGCLLVLRPFVSALLWAVVLCFSSWPVYRRLLRLLGNRRTLAAFLMSLGMILIVLLPFLIIGATLADNVKQLTAATRHWIAKRPARAARLAGQGARRRPQATEYWQSLAADTAKLWTEAQRFIEPVSALAAQRRPGAGRRLAASWP